MTHLKEDPQRLSAAIDAAFGAAAYPGDNRLVYDTSGRHLECNDVAAFYRGRRWQQVTAADLAEHQESIHFLSPEAFRYYLPAYLKAAVTDYQDADLVPEILVSALTPPADAALQSYFEQRAQPLSVEQAGVVRAVLEFLQRVHGEDFFENEPQQALDAYWAVR